MMINPAQLQDRGWIDQQTLSLEAKATDVIELTMVILPYKLAEPAVNYVHMMIKMRIINNDEQPTTMEICKIYWLTVNQWFPSSGRAIEHIGWKSTTC